MKRGEKKETKEEKLEENTDPVMIMRITKEISYHSLLASNAHQEVYRKCSQFAEEVCEDDYVPVPARSSHRTSKEKVSAWNCRMKKLMSNSCPPKKYHGQDLGKKRACGMLNIRKSNKTKI